MQPGIDGYVLGPAEPDPELLRLAALAQVYGTATQVWLDSAGLTSGMTVVDLGCGPGAVTLPVAGRVGLPEHHAVLLNPLVVGASARIPVRRAPVPPPRRGQG